MPLQLLDWTHDVRASTPSLQRQLAIRRLDMTHVRTQIGVCNGVQADKKTTSDSSADSSIKADAEKFFS